MNPGGGTAQGTTLLNAADNFAEGVASKVAPKLGNSIVGKVGTKAVRGAVDGGIGGVLDTLRGDDSENLASNIASGALGGALMFGGMKALGESVNAYNSLKSGLPELNSVKEGGVSSFTPFTKVEAQIKDTDLDGLLKGTDETLSSDPNLKLPFEVVKKADIKNNVPLSDEVAATAGPNSNASKFANDTVLNSNQADDILKEAIEDQGISYERLTNKETLENARKIINESPEKARSIISDGNKIDAETMAIGQELILKYQNEGRYDEAIDLLEDISKRGTKAGQAIQALSMWKRLTPEGMLSYAQRKVNKYNSSVGNNKGVKLSKDNAKTIVEAMQEVNKMEDGRAKDIELAKVNQYINDLIPSSFEDKIDSFRYINMLFNPKTMIKNVGGNVINTGMGSVRDTIGSGIDKLVSNKTGIRTTGLPNFGAMGEGFKKGLKETVEDYKNGVDTSMELKDGARGLIKQGAKNYASQLLPFGTLANQINKTLDPTVKDTYSSNEVEREVKKAMSKYPGLSQILPQSVDTVGEGKVYNEGQELGTSILNNFLNPSTMSYYNPSDVEANALDMYYETGDTVQAPSYHSGSITNKGKTYNLTDEEMREYSTRIAHALQYAEKTPEGYAEREE